MVPARVLTYHVTPRLPRTRGDGPFHRPALLALGWAPPHTRGWSRPGRPLRARGRGSPAHAGMVPRVSLAFLTSSGLPRTRGDGPASPSSVSALGSAPPHTRGWSRACRRHSGHRPGSPAHAGMVPNGADACRSRARLPRTRGDGPMVTNPSTPRRVAPPHTRGWSLRRTERPEFGRGSPAHAGMVPLSQRVQNVFLRLPRTRGDGPDGRLAGKIERKAPPHTRGWSQRHRDCSRRSDGSPAHAGMVPREGPAGLRGRGLPRTRGDGPRSFFVRLRATWAPPHTRGWSLHPQAAIALGFGSPAHAGMVPRTRRPRADTDRLPRTRGDGPLRLRCSGFMPAAPPHTRGWSLRVRARHARPSGSPAHAGMVPPSDRAPRWRARLPRTRGDGPAPPTGPHRSGWAPPHTRGWSQVGMVQHVAKLGSPAHAGMVPSTQGAPRRGAGLPRTRGDGPGHGGRSQDQFGAPPHTRGWSHVQIVARGGLVGSPAHAGMVPRRR